MTMTIEQYYYGLAALMYLTTCWMFSAVRWWHTRNKTADAEGTVYSQWK